MYIWGGEVAVLKWLNRFNHDKLKLPTTLFSYHFRYFRNVLWWRPLTPIWNFQFQFSQLSQQSVLAAWLKTCTLIKHKKCMVFFILWVNDDRFLMAARSRKIHFKLISKFLYRCHGNNNLTWNCTLTNVVNPKSNSDENRIAIGQG